MIKKVGLCILVSSFMVGHAQARDFVFAAQDFPPFNFLQDKEPVGGMIDVMKAACEKLKYTCKFEIHALARAQKLVEYGEVDGILSLLKTPERKETFNFSADLIQMHLVYMGLAKSKFKPFTDLSGLAGYTAVATRGSAPLKIVKEHAAKVPGVKVIEDVDNPTMIRDLARDKYGPKALIASTEEVLKYTADQQNVALETVYVISESPMVNMFSKKKMTEEETKKFSDVLLAMRKDGTVKKLIAKYGLRATE